MFDTVILADDLSGAADCAVACVQRGLATTVTLGEPSGVVQADVISIDADTRRLDPTSAAERMRALTAAFAPRAETLLFKKIDSSLRGHLGPEVAAVLEARRAGGARTVAVMAPALPASGRTVRSGSAYLNGTPLHETELWRNQKMAGEAYIPGMLQQAGLSSTRVDLALVRGTGLGQALRDAASRFDVLLCDSVTDEDLELIAAAVQELPCDVVWVGSAGLARHLPYRSSAAGSETALPLSGTDKPLLFVVGSMCRTARKQVASLASSEDIRTVTVAPELLVHSRDSAQWREAVAELENAVRQGRDVVLTSAAAPVLRIAERPQLSRALAAMTAGIRGEVGALVACGGETARMVLDCWGVRGLRLLGELERGVVVSKALSAEMDVTVVTKAGDFGAPETLARCRQWLRAGTEIRS